MEELYEVYEISLLVVEDTDPDILTTKLAVEKRDGMFKLNTESNRFIEVNNPNGCFNSTKIPNYVSISNNYGLRAYKGYVSDPNTEELEIIKEELRSALITFLKNRRDSAIAHYDKLLGAFEV